MTKLKRSLPSDSPEKNDGYSTAILASLIVGGAVVMAVLAAAALSLRPEPAQEIKAAPAQLSESEQEAAETPAVTPDSGLADAELGAYARLAGVKVEVPEETPSSTEKKMKESTLTTPAETSSEPSEPATSEPTLTEPEPTAPTSTPAPASGPSAAAWAKLRECEAGGRYDAINPVGYYGAYQFNQRTWNAVASSIGREDLVGVLPSVAAPADQDALAFALYRARGAQPWPSCGRHLR